DLGSTIRDYATPFLVINNWGEGIRDFQFQMSALPSYRFARVFTAGTLEVFKVASNTPDRGPTLSDAACLDTSALQRGLRQLISGNYAAATADFLVLEHNEIAGVLAKYYRATAVECLDDFANARALFSEISAGPQSGSVLANIIAHREAMDLVHEARSGGDPTAKAEALVAASINYWYLGLPKRAHAIADEAVRCSPRSLNPHLFRALFSVQAGWPEEAHAFMAAAPPELRAESSWVALAAVIGYTDSLAMVSDRARYSLFLMGIARGYESLGLVNQAIASGWNALGHNPENPDALQFLCKNLSRIGRFRPAYRCARELLRLRPYDPGLSDQVRFLGQYL
ncbi:MAG: hypothetical protein WCK00_09180, partial [Deltaproteobacteria bacterium]